ncbi:hypothetical protein HDU97_006171, partial [Phlyctochytrium planicorne]
LVLRVQQIVQKLDKQVALTSDSQGIAVGAEDVVMVDDHSGAISSRVTVVHIYHTFIFMFSREVKENGSI